MFFRLMLWRVFCCSRQWKTWRHHGRKHKLLCCMLKRNTFRRVYKRQPPEAKIIKKWTKAFLETGSVMKRAGLIRSPSLDYRLDILRTTKAVHLGVRWFFIRNFGVTVICFYIFLKFPAFLLTLTMSQNQGLIWFGYSAFKTCLFFHHLPWDFYCTNFNNKLF